MRGHAVGGKLMCQSLAGLAVSATCVLAQDEARAAGGRGSTIAERALPALPADWAQAAGPGGGRKPVDTQTLRRLRDEAEGSIATAQRMWRMRN